MAVHRGNRGRFPGSKPTRLPALPPPNDPRFLDAVKESLEQVTGLRGDSQDRMVTFRDLQDADLAKSVVETGVAGGASVDQNTGGTTGPGPVMTVPPSVKGLVAEAAYSRVVVTWNAVSFGNYAYTEIARTILRPGEETGSIADSVIVGRTSARIFTDVLGSGISVVYWARNISTSNVKGPWAGPTPKVTTPLAFDVVRDEATSRIWQPNTAYSVYNHVIPSAGEPLYIEIPLAGEPPVNGQPQTTRRAVIYSSTTGGISGATEPDWASKTTFGQTIEDGTVVWQLVDAGEIPFMIDKATGLTVIEAAAIRRASIDVAQIRDGFFDNLTAEKGTISEANIAIADIFVALIQNYIQSEFYSPGEYGWRLSKNGDAEFNNLRIRGLFHSGQLVRRGDDYFAADGEIYIDGRDGVSAGVPGMPDISTKGDLRLGDVESGDNYISFEYEPQAGQKILRVRGNILLRDFKPGNILYHDNDLPSGDSSIKRSSYGAYKAYYFFYSNGLENPLAPVYQNVDFNYGDFEILKSTFVYGAGVIRVFAEGTLKDEPYRYMTSNVPVPTAPVSLNSVVLAIAIKQRNGETRIVKRLNHSEWKRTQTGLGGYTYNWEFNGDIRVDFGEEIQVVATGFATVFFLMPGENRFVLNTNYTNDLYGIERYGKAKCSRMILSVDSPYETMSIK